MDIIIELLITFILLATGEFMIIFSDRRLWKPNGSILRDIVALLGIIITVLGLFFPFI